MDKETKRRAKITIMGILGLVLLIIGISFAAFSANLAGVQVQTMNTGCLKVDMTDEGSVNTDNAMPETDESGLSGDPYTYKITNSCTTDAYYTTTINVMSTSKLENADKIKVALDGDSYLAPTIESSLPASELLDDTITGVSKTYKLDEGYLKVGETKTFELRTWIDYDVESISGSLENKIIINSVADNDGAITYNKNTAGYYVLSNNTKLSSADYTKISPSTEQPSGIIEVKDNSGTTYHFRGNPNNYLLFGTYNEDGTVSYTNSSGTASSLTYKSGDKIKWRILGTNNDGSINIIKDDLIGENTIDSSATIMSNFYTKHLQDEENYINTSQQFCNETKDANNNYLAKIRVEKHNPTSECNSTNKVTKIGLPTVDDVMYAGGVNNTANTSFYLYKDIKGFLTSSYASDANIYQSSKTKSIGEIAKTTALDIRPVITLKSDTKLEGSGTEENPFYVSGKYGQEESNTSKDSIAPIIDKVSVDAKWSNKNKNIDIAARDNSTGSGLAGYIVKTENKTPTLTETGWEASTSSKYTTVNSYDNGTYYVFAKDNAGNISEGRKIVIEKVDKEAPTCMVRINPNGTTAPYKTLSIISNDTNIDLDGYSWDHTNYTEDVVKVTDNGSYTGHLTDLAGNKGSCTAVVTNVEPTSTDNLMATVGKSGLEAITHSADSTLQIGATSDITEYRYIGNDDVVTNNYIYFNCSDINNQTQDTCELYRIIGIFPVEDASGNIENRIKVIKHDSYGSKQYSDSSFNDYWTNSLSNELNQTYFNSMNANYQNFIGDSKYYLGGWTGYNVRTTTYYEYERKAIAGSYFKTGIYNWTGKLGLMYVSDYGYATSSACRNNKTLDQYNDSSCTDNNWLYTGISEWVYGQNSSDELLANIIESDGRVSGNTADSSLKVRPVFYLKKDVKLNDTGIGTYDNPYQLTK